MRGYFVYHPVILKKIRVLGFLLVLLCIAACATRPAAMVTVEGARIMPDVTPDTNYIFPMAVSTNPTDPPSDYAVDVPGFGQGLDGDMPFLRV